jgi:hypothetical protein
MLWVAGALVLIGSLVAAAHFLRTSLVRWLYGERITKEVQSLLGAEAEVTHVAVDTKWRLVLAAKNLTIPGGLKLDVSEARIRGLGRPDDLVVESIDGALAWRGLRASVSYRANEKPTAPLDGSLTARGATWREGAPPFDFEGTLRVAKNDYTLKATKVTCDGATGQGELAGTDGPPRTTLKAEKIGAPLLGHLVALIVPKREHEIPAKSVSEGTLEIAPDFTRKLDLRLMTVASDVLLAARISPAGELAGSKVTGTLSFADALEAKIFTTRIRPKPVHAAALDLGLRGTTDAPVLAGMVGAARVEVEAGGLAIEATDAASAIELDARGLRWGELEANALGGRLRGSGVIDARGHSSEVRVEGVRVQDLPVGISDPLLLGFVTGVLTLRGKGDATESLEGEGQLEVREPEYRFLRQASESLRPFGLPDLPTRGSEPFRSRIIFGGGRVTFREIQGRVDGMRFEGSIDVYWSRRLSGTILVHLEQRYLSRSVVLALPSIFTGQLSVPLEISGQVGTPTYTADLVGTLGRLVTGNSVTGAITGLVDGVLGNLLGGERRDDTGKPKRGGLGGFLDALS